MSPRGHAEEFAPAKINLFLHVLGRRADGYHLLDSLAVFAAVGDRLRYEAEGEKLKLVASGPFAGALPAAGADNLVVRAAAALARHAGRAASGTLHLQKNLPVASGIGGGSADAAAALRLLGRRWGVAAPDPALAASLGADVPVCLRSAPARMGGMGERLTEAPGLPPFGLVLANPGVAVSTASVFAARAGAWSEPARLPARWEAFDAMIGDLAWLSNDLERAACTLCPAIAEVLALLAGLPGCGLARLSGSGATCFGVFRSVAAAEAAARSIAARPGLWVWGGGLARAVAGGEGVPL